MKSLLLHTCCAPCMSYVYELLKAEYRVTAYFYNPNIAPAGEYTKRLSELKRFASLKDFLLLYGEYDIRDWAARVKEYRSCGERSPRCFECYRFRLEKSFKKARDCKADIVATVLSISPHKDAAMLNTIGKELEQEYGIEFLEADFKKKDGFKKSAALSKEYGFYRQDYCGCVYSRLERDKSFTWKTPVPSPDV
ncbi:MAG: epoxyqueuosine reductase QueH [bacterium]|nr:epoxyqueuosine reductase QueH [bacterium]